MLFFSSKHVKRDGEEEVDVGCFKLDIQGKKSTKLKMGPNNKNGL